MPENNNTATIIKELAFAETNEVFEIGLGATETQELQDAFSNINDNFETLNQTIEDNELVTSAALNELDTKINTLPYALSKVPAGASENTVGILRSQVDASSTSTAFSANVNGVTELRDGVCILLTNGVVDSASGCTLNINSLGAKPIYSTLSSSSAITTEFKQNYTMLFVYNSTRVANGCWDMFYGYYDDSQVLPSDFGFGYGTCTTAQATTEKSVTIQNYSLVSGGYVSVKFTNDVPANSTMNINSAGAKSIYYLVAAITSDVIYAGDTATFVYDGTNYHLISIDTGFNIVCGDYAVVTP